MNTFVRPQVYIILLQQVPERMFQIKSINFEYLLILYEQNPIS